MLAEQVQGPGFNPQYFKKIETWVELNSLLYFSSAHSTLAKGKQYVYSYLQHKKKKMPRE